MPAKANGNAVVILPGGGYDVCHFTESTLYAEALTRHGVDAELHLFARGGHGFGPGRDKCIDSGHCYLLNSRLQSVQAESRRI